ncbi:hypothetical protein BKA70DRAFT_1432976 [Coprinopsis sp. MPI-PUGE-AT-0042]|nr:hypothetical protein BKA70DRAFT_1432976 [Coprinopsis sp. MPI-PUGE-AT-0042]
MSTMEASFEGLKFRSTDLDFNAVVAALRDQSSKTPITLKPNEDKDRWTVCNATTGRAAIFAHVFHYLWGSTETGNYVPQGKTPPEKLPAGRIRRFPSNQCEWTYTFNTSEDKSLYDGMKVIEDFALAVPGFNKDGVPKSDWQDPNNATNNVRYIAASKMFVDRTEKNWPAGGSFKVPYKVHPWVEQGLHRSPRLAPNKDRPRVYEYSDGRLRSIDKASPAKLERNDIVWVAFTIHFAMGDDNWSQQVTPLDIVRVGHRETKRSKGNSDDDMLDWQPLQTGVRFGKDEGLKEAEASTSATSGVAEANARVDHKRKRNETEAEEGPLKEEDEAKLFAMDVEPGPSALPSVVPKEPLGMTTRKGKERRIG